MSFIKIRSSIGPTTLPWGMFEDSALEYVVSESLFNLTVSCPLFTDNLLFFSKARKLKASDETTQVLKNVNGNRSAILFCPS